MTLLTTPNRFESESDLLYSTPTYLLTHTRMMPYVYQILRVALYLLNLRSV